MAASALPRPTVVLRWVVVFVVAVTMVVGTTRLLRAVTDWGEITGIIGGCLAGAIFGFGQRWVEGRPPFARRPGPEPSPAE